MKDTFWDKYYQRPLEQIPWHKYVEADWFRELVDKRVIKGSSALDLGCGTGEKSVYLAKCGGFEKVVGVDIAKRAIEVANEKATHESVTGICTFLCHDATDWSFLEEGEPFDFILDWANLHGIPLDRRRQYIDGINKHSHKGTLLLIRTFSSDSDTVPFTKEVDGERITHYVFEKAQIEELFPEFKVLKENISKPKKEPTPGVFLLELLMRKR